MKHVLSETAVAVGSSDSANESKGDQARLKRRSQPRELFARTMAEKQRAEGQSGEALHATAVSDLNGYGHHHPSCVSPDTVP